MTWRIAPEGGFAGDQEVELGNRLRHLAPIRETIRIGKDRNTGPIACAGVGILAGDKTQHQDLVYVPADSLSAIRLGVCRPGPEQSAWRITDARSSILALGQLS